MRELHTPPLCYYDILRLAKLLNFRRFKGQEDMLALKLANSKRWEDVRLESFRQMAKNIGDEESHMVVRVQAAIDSIINSWNESGKDFGYDSEARKKLERHFRRIPILKPNFIKS